MNLRAGTMEFGSVLWFQAGTRGKMGLLAVGCSNQYLQNWYRLRDMGCVLEKITNLTDMGVANLTPWDWKSPRVSFRYVWFWVRVTAPPCRLVFLSVPSRGIQNQITRCSCLQGDDSLLGKTHNNSKVSGEGLCSGRNSPDTGVLLPVVR